MNPLSFSQATKYHSVSFNRQEIFNEEILTVVSRIVCSGKSMNNLFVSYKLNFNEMFSTQHNLNHDIFAGRILQITSSMQKRQAGWLAQVKYLNERFLKLKQSLIQHRIFYTIDPASIVDQLINFMIRYLLINAVTSDIPLLNIKYIVSFVGDTEPIKLKLVYQDKEYLSLTIIGNEHKALLEMFLKRIFIIKDLIFSQKSIVIKDDFNFSTIKRLAAHTFNTSGLTSTDKITGMIANQLPLQFTVAELIPTRFYKKKDPSNDINWFCKDAAIVSLRFAVISGNFTNIVNRNTKFDIIGAIFNTVNCLNSNITLLLPDLTTYNKEEIDIFYNHLGNHTKSSVLTALNSIFSTEKTHEFILHLTKQIAENILILIGNNSHEFYHNKLLCASIKETFSTERYKNIKSVISLLNVIEAKLLLMPCITNKNCTSDEIYNKFFSEIYYIDESFSNHIVFKNTFQCNDIVVSVKKFLSQQTDGNYHTVQICLTKLFTVCVFTQTSDDTEKMFMINLPKTFFQALQNIDIDSLKLFNYFISIKYQNTNLKHYNHTTFSNNTLEKYVKNYVNQNNYSINAERYGMFYSIICSDEKMYDINIEAFDEIEETSVFLEMFLRTNTARNELFLSIQQAVLIGRPRTVKDEVELYSIYIRYGIGYIIFFAIPNVIEAEHLIYLIDKEIYSYNPPPTKQ